MATRVGFIGLGDMGKAMAPLDAALKVPATKVDGCASQVWLHPIRVDGRIDFEGDSDAMIVFHMRRAVLDDDRPVIVAATSDLRWPAGFSGHLRDSFDLTAAEAEVIRGMVECANLSEIAQRRGRSLATVRAQLKTIFAKTGTGTLVLDDYHLIHDARIHELLSELLRHPPRRFHLVVLSRADPPLPLARLRARGRITEIRQHNLCFSRE